MFTIDSRFLDEEHKMFMIFVLLRGIAIMAMVIVLFFSYNLKQMRFVRIHYVLDMFDRNLKLTTKSANATMKMVATCIVVSALMSIFTLLRVMYFLKVNLSFQEQELRNVLYICKICAIWAIGVFYVHYSHITQGIAARFMNVSYKIAEVVVGNNFRCLMPYQIFGSGSSCGKFLNNLTPEYYTRPPYSRVNLGVATGLTSAGRIKALIRDYWLLCDTVREANAFYGDQLLAVVLTSFFSIVVSLSACVMSYTKDNISGTTNAGIWSLANVSLLFLLSYLTTNVTESAEEMKRTVCRLINMETDDEIQEQLEEFLLQLSNHKVELSACGFFNINYQALTSRKDELVAKVQEILDKIQSPTIDLQAEYIVCDLSETGANLQLRAELQIRVNSHSIRMVDSMERIAVSEPLLPKYNVLEYCYT
ncbi:gustatory receptor [Homalodisca vitripennis]|nr:gustatory receptor [Homalodisca vitripennis]